MSPWLSGRLLGSQSDERLAGLAAEGREQAFAVLVERHQSQLLTFVRGLGTDGRAEDVVQQALMQAWIALRAGTEVDHVRGWLFQIARRTSWRATAVPRAEQLSPALTTGADTEGEVERRQEARRLLAEIERLPRRQHDALVQTALEGRSGPEVAAELGLTQNALRQLLFRARTTLRAGAGAVVPFPLVAWAASRSNSTSPMSERVSQIVGSGGATGSAAGVMKIAAVLAVGGAVVGGAAIRHDFSGTPEVRPTKVSQRPDRNLRPSSVADASGTPPGASSVQLTMTSRHSPPGAGSGDSSGRPEGHGEPTRPGPRSDIEQGGPLRQGDKATTPAAVGGQATEGTSTNSEHTPHPPSSTEQDSSQSASSEQDSSEAEEESTDAAPSPEPGSPPDPTLAGAES